MKRFIAILSLALAALSFAAPSYSADVNNAEVNKEKKTAQLTQNHADKKVVKNNHSVVQAKKDAKALAKQKKEQQKAAKKAKKLAKKPNPKSPKAHAVPEIDGSYAALAICLLAGAVAIRRERHRKA